MKTKERIYLIFRNRGANGKELMLCDSSEKEFRVLAGQLVNEQEPTQEKPEPMYNAQASMDCRR